MFRRLSIVVMLLVLLASAASAQGQGRDMDAVTPLRVQVVFSEFEGEKKVLSLPYTLPVNAATEMRRAETSKVRVGVRVPIITQGKEGPITQYFDVGSHIDARGAITSDGRYQLDLNLRRSFIHTPQAEKTTTAFPLMHEGTPIVRNFDIEVRLLFKDGETIQSTMATDPVSGRVLKVDVTLNVVK